MTYVDVARPDEGKIMPECVAWINKVIRDATPFVLPKEYAEKYLKPHIPPTSEEDEQRDIEMVEGYGFEKEARLG
jgi:gamma-glutamylcyclotransferase